MLDEDEQAICGVRLPRESKAQKNSFVKPLRRVGLNKHKLNIYRAVATLFVTNKEVMSK